MNFTLSSSSCLVCFKNIESESGNDIEICNYDELSYSSIYEYCTGYSVKKGNAISPNNICNECENHLLQMYEFRRTCETSENILVYINQIIQDKLDSVKINIENNDCGEDLYSIDSYVVAETVENDIKIDLLEDSSNDADVPILNDVLEEFDIEKHQGTESAMLIKVEIEAEPYQPTTKIERISPSNEKNAPMKLKNIPSRRSPGINSEKNITINSETNECTTRNKCKEKSIEMGLAESNDNFESAEELMLNGTVTSDKEVRSQKKKRVCKTRGKAKAKRKKDDVTKMRKILCQECGKILPIKYMKNHMMLHETKDGTEKKYSCDICGNKYKYADSLNKHKRIHTGDMRYECPYCKMIFMNWGTKRRHVDKEHIGITRYECHLCDAKFYDSSARVSHIRRVHCNDSYFECEVCQKRFTHAYKLKWHMPVHTNERKYVCDICNKGYLDSKALRMHKLLHTGERNYKCPVCSKAFFISYLLRTHIQKSHPHCELPPLGTILTPDIIEALDIN